MSPDNRVNDITQNMYSWHVLNPPEMNQHELYPPPSSSSSFSYSSSIPADHSMASSGLGESDVASFQPQYKDHRRISIKHQGTASSINPLTLPINCPDNYPDIYSSKSCAGRRVQREQSQDEGEGVRERLRVVYEAIQGLPSTRYTLDDLLPSLVTMAHADRRNSISLSEQCEIMQVLGDLVLSYNFDLELKRINQQIMAKRGRLNENMERDEDVCSLYDPDEIFYTLLSDALASR